MSREKQIEEMAAIAAHCCDCRCMECDCIGTGEASCYEVKAANALYNAGYRKQSEGKWKKRGNEKTCSLCKFIYYSNNDEWNFCPNCGAKMGKEDEGK